MTAVETGPLGGSGTGTRLPERSNLSPTCCVAPRTSSLKVRPPESAPSAARGCQRVAAGRPNVIVFARKRPQPLAQSGRRSGHGRAREFLARRACIPSPPGETRADRSRCASSPARGEPFIRRAVRWTDNVDRALGGDVLMHGRRPALGNAWPFHLRVDVGTSSCGMRLHAREVSRSRPGFRARQMVYDRSRSPSRLLPSEAALAVEAAGLSRLYEPVVATFGAP